MAVTFLTNEDGKKFVKSINNVQPDENGNVEIAIENPDVDLTGYATEEFVVDKIVEAEVDLSGYAKKSELPTKVSQLDNDKGYLTEHQDISGKLDANKLPEAINSALAQAKASGAFDGADGKDGKDGIDGKDGYTPQKNVDYFDGKDGKDGQDGYTPQKGIDYFDGQPGKDGVDGQDGYTPVKGKDYFDGQPGRDGVDGKDYVLTDADKAEIAEQAAELVEVPAPDSGGNVDKGGLSDTAKNLLIAILRNAIYSTDQSANITLLESVLSSGGGSSGGGVVQYSITNNLTNITNSNAAVTVAENGVYIATLTASEGYEIDSVTVTMGGVDVTASVYSGGAVTIPSVTGNIVITASAVEAAPESAYIQDGLLHEFTDLTTARTITGGQSIFNSENDFTVFASSANRSVEVISGGNNDHFHFWFNWNGSINAKVWLTDNSYYPSIVYNPSNTSDGIMEHVCVVKSGDTYTMYVYEADGSYSDNSQSMNSFGKQYIQNDDLVINDNNKQIDKILIYNRALSETEINKNFTAMKQEVGE